MYFVISLLLSGRDATLLLKTGWCEDEYDADECADPDGRVRLLDADRFMTDPKGLLCALPGILLRGRALYVQFSYGHTASQQAPFRLKSAFWTN